MKKCLLDTNFISEILKKTITLRTDFRERIFKNHQILLPLLSLSELSERSDLLLQLIEFSKKQRVLISKSSSQIFEEEIKTFGKNDFPRTELIDLSASVFDNELHMKKYFVSDEFLQATISLKDTEKIALNNIEMLRKYDYKSGKEYVKDYLFTKLSQKAPEIYSKYTEDRNNSSLRHFRSVIMQGSFIFYKYNKKNIKSEPSDINDALIISQLPYVDFFITERRNGSLIRELKPKEKLIENLEILLFRDIIN